MSRFKSDLFIGWEIISITSTALCLKGCCRETEQARCLELCKPVALKGWCPAGQLPRAGGHCGSAWLVPVGSWAGVCFPVSPALQAPEDLNSNELSIRGSFIPFQSHIKVILAFS